MKFNASTVRNQCNGMLSERVYQRIYETARDAPSGSFVEVGAAHGAGTVTLAHALRDGGRHNAKVYSFEKIVGGSREKFGDFEQNRKIIEDNISKFDLTDTIEMIFGDVGAEHVRVAADEPISLLMLDADGRLDRDFGFFFDRLAPSAPIIIDDVSCHVRAKCLSKTFETHHLRIDQKHRISDLLVGLFRHHGLIEGEMVDSTFFGYKRGGMFAGPVAAEVISCYHELVFADVAYEAVPGGIGGMCKRSIARMLPDKLVEGLRRLRYG